MPCIIIIVHYKLNNNNNILLLLWLYSPLRTLASTEVGYLDFVAILSIFCIPSLEHPLPLATWFLVDLILFVPLVSI